MNKRAQHVLTGLINCPRLLNIGEKKPPYLLTKCLLQAPANISAYGVLEAYAVRNLIRAYCVYILSIPPIITPTSPLTSSFCERCQDEPWGPKGWQVFGRETRLATGKHNNQNLCT